ncbi:hypothetical protein DFH07DRAFT_771076 [Mycena maculata]|uniref:Uncharacterized protein n=1 Tax=Mycena maculata TaxID=230809 RepID=A0AAD7JCY9_9AGAR|nr:hypothetical protein DFH07DRAFT_771076 [Mycena maculata]
MALALWTAVKNPSIVWRRDPFSTKNINRVREQDAEPGPGFNRRPRDVAKMLPVTVADRPPALSLLYFIPTATAPPAHMTEIFLLPPIALGLGRKLVLPNMWCIYRETPMRANICLFPDMSQPDYIAVDGYQLSLLFTFSPLPPRSLVRVKLYISNEVNRARDKVREPEEVFSLLRSRSGSSHISGVAGSTNRNADAGAQPLSMNKLLEGTESLESKLQCAVEQLNTRIEEMEGHSEILGFLGPRDNRMSQRRPV